jgi:predicted polyphosphate/ATP-dependent NAD kinase
VAYGSVFDNHEKVNIVRRIILGLNSMGVPEAIFMPDFYGIGIRAIEGLDVAMKISFLEMEMEGHQDDSTLAARLLHDMRVGCIITLGGDGTNRAVAKTCRDTPLLPISTGTNNVFPFMVEGTLAGIAAGVAAQNRSEEEHYVKQAPRLEVRRNGDLIDMALVDVVVSKSGFVASRAMWDVSILKEIFLSKAGPENIGFSAIGGLIFGAPLARAQGAYLAIGKGGKSVRAPIAPGLICSVPVLAYRHFSAEEEIRISHTPALIALDGERELVVPSGDVLSVSLNPEGPRVVDIPSALRWAAEQGLFIEHT